jgi:hypothetical protein
MKQCDVEGCNNRVWSKGMCKNHIPKKPISKITNSVKTQQNKIDKKVNTIATHNFFLEIWKERKHCSEVSGTYLGNEAMSTYFHHVLPKSKYPEACLDKENIILLTLDEHTDVENDMYRYEKINERRNQLNLKYNL